MIVETIDLDSDIENYENENENENENVETFNDSNIFYSYPYYSADNIDYQYRITYSSDELVLDEIKVNEDSFSPLDTLVVLKSYTFDDFEGAFDLIQDFKDLRTSNKLEFTDSTIRYDISEREDSKEILENNKKLVLYDLYKSVLE